MGKYIFIVGLSLLITLGAALVSHIKTAGLEGPSFARRTYKIGSSFLPIVLIVCAGLRFGTHAIAVPGSLILSGALIRLLAWPFFKIRRAGTLVLDAGRIDAQHSGSTRIELLSLIASAFFLTRYSVTHQWQLFDSFVLIGGAWTVLLTTLLMKLSHIEFRDNGITYLLRFYQWQRVQSYQWDDAIPSTLTLHFKPRPLFSKPVSIAIPVRYHAAAKRVLQVRFPSAELHIVS